MINWSTLRPGMSPEEVVGCVGEPTSLGMSEQAAWTYEYEKYYGKIIFTCEKDGTMYLRECEIKPN